VIVELTHRESAMSLEDARRARARAAQARTLAATAADRTTARLLRVASRLEACAAAGRDLAGADGPASVARAAERLRAAQRLRELACEVAARQARG
jgi:hypothetical protein